MKYKINKQYSVELPISEIVELLKKVGVLPEDMKPERNIHAGASVTANVIGSAKASCLVIKWEETEEIDEDAKEKTRQAVDMAAKLRSKSKKKRR